MRWTRQRRHERVRAGRVVPVSPKPACERAALSSSSRQHSFGACAHCRRTLWRRMKARTAKPCGTGRRRYGQAFAEVWSVQPDQPHRKFAGRGRPEGIRLPGEHGISRQPIAQGRPCVGLHLYAAVRSFCATFSRSRPRVLAGTRPSLRPLGKEGGEIKQSSGELRREAAKACLRPHTRCHRRPCAHLRTGAGDPVFQRRRG